MTSDVGIVAAFVAGIVSFLSPCVLPLVPPYMVYLTGASLDQAGDQRGKGQALATAFVFVLGFATVFVALGAGASAIGGLLRTYSRELSIIAGISIIIMGLHFLGLFRLGFLMMEKRAQVEKPAGLGGAYVMGLAFAFGWTPCIGPVLAAILAVAASEATVVKGAGLLAVYSAGLGVPFLLAALMMGPFMRFLKGMRGRMHVIEKVMGALLVLTGIAFLSGWITQFSFWLIEMFPVLGTIG